MKLYRARTQEEYDFLMWRLKNGGYLWGGANQPTLFNHWARYKASSVIYATDNKNLLYGHVENVDENEKVVEVSDLMEGE